MKSKWNKLNFDKPGIYLIKIKGHFYIGKTDYAIKSRLISHMTLLKSNKHYNKKLQKYYNLYGSKYIRFSVLETCECWDSYLKERLYIDLLNPDINITIYNQIENKEKYWNKGMFKSNKQKQEIKKIVNQLAEGWYK